MSAPADAGAFAHAEAVGQQYVAGARAISTHAHRLTTAEASEPRGAKVMDICEICRPDRVLRCLCHAILSMALTASPVGESHTPSVRAYLESAVTTHPPRERKAPGQVRQRDDRQQPPARERRKQTGSGSRRKWAWAPAKPSRLGWEDLPLPIRREQ